MFKKSNKQPEKILIVDRSPPTVQRVAYQFKCADDGKVYYSTSMGVVNQYSQEGGGVPSKAFPAKLDKSGKVVEVEEAISLDAKRDSPSM